MRVTFLIAIKSVCRSLFAIFVTLSPIVVLDGCYRGRLASPSVAPPDITAVQWDSISIVSVKLLSGYKLDPAGLNQFLVRIAYTLQTYDSALLSLSIDEFNNPHSCIPKTVGTGDVLGVESKSVQFIPIQRGTHFVDIHLNWEGVDMHVSNTAKAGATGTISFQGSMWIDNPRYRFLSRSFGTSFCTQF
jgi:hypothetical protein